MPRLRTALLTVQATLLASALVLAPSYLSFAADEPASRFTTISGDAVRPRAVLRAPPLTLVENNADWMDAVFSREGRHLVSVDSRGVLSRHDLDSNQIEWMHTLTVAPVVARFSADAEFLAIAGSHGELQLCETAKEKPRWKQSFDQERIVTLQFNRDSTRLACVTEQGIYRILRTRDGAVEQTWEGQSAPMQFVDWIPNDDDLIYAPLGGAVQRRRFRAAADELIMPAPSPVSGLAVSPSGKQLAVPGKDGVVRLLQLSQPGEVRELTGHTFAVWKARYAEHDGTLATSAWDGAIRLWDPTDGRPLGRFKDHSESVTTMLFRPDGRGLVTASLDGAVRYYENDVPSLPPQQKIAGRSGQVWVSVISRDGRHLLSGGESRVELWNLQQQTLLWQHNGDGTTRAAAFSPDGRHLATGDSERNVTLWEVATGDRHLLGKHPGLVSTVVFSSDGERLFSGCDRREVKAWSLSQRTLLDTWLGHREQIYCSALSPDGRQLLTAGGNWTANVPGELLVWNLASGEVEQRLEPHRLAVWSIDFSADAAHMATSSSDGTVRIWSYPELQLVRELTHSTWVRPLAFSSDGKSLAVGRGDGSVRLWDTSSWTQKLALAGHDTFTFDLQFHPLNNTLFAAGNDGVISIWHPRP